VSGTSVTSAEAFEARYLADADPWNFAGSPYEQKRYETTINALRRAHYQSVFEPGCSVGELTARLAERCAILEACDFSPSVVERARQRCRGFEHVSINCADLRTSMPEGPFDLIVFSEIGYYFDRPTLVEISTELASKLCPGGEFIAVHWLGRSPDHVLHGDAVHDILQSFLPLAWVKGDRHPDFRWDSWGRT
jgi:SAM-dependent methyltransferase